MFFIFYLSDVSLGFHAGDAALAEMYKSDAASFPVQCIRRHVAQTCPIMSSRWSLGDAGVCQLSLLQRCNSFQCNQCLVETGFKFMWISYYSSNFHPLFSPSLNDSLEPTTVLIVDKWWFSKSTNITSRFICWLSTVKSLPVHLFIYIFILSPTHS